MAERSEQGGVGPGRVASRVGRLAVTAAVVALGFAYWASRLSFPRAIGIPELDPSWQEAMGVALLGRMQAGVDLVFTYGPLGYFHSSPYVPELFGWKVCGWELALRPVLSAFVAAAALRQRAPLERVALMLAALVPLAGEEVGYFVGLIAAATWLVARPERALALQALACAAIALVALVKFTYFLLALVCAAAVAVAIGSRAPRRAVAYAGLQAAAFAGAWLAAGQSPANAWRWVEGSLEIVSGYNQAMAAYGPPREVALAIATAAVAALAIGARAWRARREPAALAASVLLLAALYLGYKAGFTRHGTNSVTFFGLAAVVAWFVPEPASARSRGERALDRAGLAARLAAAGLGILGYGLASGMLPGAPRELATLPWRALRDNLSFLADLGAQRDELERSRAAWTQYLDLPRVRERVGGETVDCFFQTQSIVFRNGLRWRPRPVFQSYSAYTPALAAANARCYEGPDAPRYVLFRFETTDARLPSMEDADALAALLRGYEPVLSEHEYLLFERRREPKRAPAPEVALESTAAFGERIDLTGAGGGCLRLALDLRPTTRGALWTAVAKARRLHLVLEIDDGRRETFRLIPGMVREGVLVAPYLDSQDAWIGWIAGEPTHGAVAATVVCEPAGVADWEPTFGVRVLRDDALVPGVDERRARELRYAMFATPPAEVRSPEPLRQVAMRQRTALVVHAPGAVRYDLEAGAYRLTGRFGIDEHAVAARCTDGATFQVLAYDGEAQRVLFERTIDPVRVPADARSQALEVEFEVARPTKVYLRTQPGPAGDGACDATWWSALRVERRERDL